MVDEWDRVSLSNNSPQVATTVSANEAKVADVQALTDKEEIEAPTTTGSQKNERNGDRERSSDRPVAVTPSHDAANAMANV